MKICESCEKSMIANEKNFFFITKSKPKLASYYSTFEMCGSTSFGIKHL